MANCLHENIPMKLSDALTNPIWLDAMHAKLHALDQNNQTYHVPQTWMLQIVNGYIRLTSKWIYKTKYKSNGSMEWCKARLVVQG